MDPISSALPPVGQSAPAALPPIDPAMLPAEIRNGSAKDKQTYQADLGFEQMLLGQMTKSMVATANPTDDGSGDGTDSSDSSGSSDSTSSDAATSLYMSMLPDQLTSALMSNGGVGLAQGFFDSTKASGA